MRSVRSRWLADGAKRVSESGHEQNAGNGILGRLLDARVPPSVAPRNDGEVRAMKPAAFEYSRPADIDEACALLAADDGARLIAGGQTLVPLMAMRLARPTRLIDIARIPGLAYVRDEGGDIAIGATTRQHVGRERPVVRAKLPLLAKVMPFVGHTATRARGTVGGSLANGDPAAEIVLVAVDARRDIGLARGRREHFHRGVRFLPRPDGDGAAADRLPRGGALSGVAGAAGRRGLPRGQRAAERFRVRVGRGADRARRRRPLHARGHRHRWRRPPCRCGSMRWLQALNGKRFDEGAVREAVERGARRHRAHGRSARLGRISQARRRDARAFAPSPTPIDDAARRA